MRRWTIPLSVVLVSALLPFSAQSFDLRRVALKFLHLHAVPCGAVVKADSALGADIVACEDGREWALFWVENEVAFIDPQTRRLYRWRPDVHRSHPQLYGSSAVSFQIPAAGGP